MEKGHGLDLNRKATKAIQYADIDRVIGEVPAKDYYDFSFNFDSTSDKPTV
jgi:hypothetical protein